MSENNQDISLICKRCHEPFVWTAGQQDHLQILLSENLIPEIATPKQCVTCRNGKKALFARRALKNK